MEAKPLADIKASNIEWFVWKSIISKFRMPRVIVIDKEIQFNLKDFKDFCQRCRSDLSFASVAYPQTNGHAEVANKSILNALKKKLDVKNKNG